MDALDATDRRAKRGPGACKDSEADGKDFAKTHIVAGAVGQDERVRLLIVEDEDAIAEPLAEGLRREGFEVTRAPTGAEALAAGPVDLVLLDLRLPDRDGLDVCRELPERSGVPIIVVTARGEEADRVVGLELGADDYVVKPFGLRELIARIRAVSRRSRGEREDRVVRVGQLEVTSGAAGAPCRTRGGADREGV
jgi:DNA-binding response OmpR family regulator